MLEILQAEARLREGWERYADYCGLRIQGKRQQSKNCLQTFASDAMAWQINDKREFVVWLLQNLQDYPITSQCPAFDEPLTSQLIRPVLEDWATESLNDARPHRWLGMFFDDAKAVSHLTRAIEIDGGEQLARSVLLGKYFDHLWNATQSLDDGKYLGDAAGDSELIETSYEILEGIDDMTTRTYWTLLFDEKKQKVQQWLGRSILAVIFSFICCVNSCLAEEENLGYIDKSGKVIINKQFDFACGFNKGVSIAEVTEQYFIIDKAGKRIAGPYS